MNMKLRPLFFSLLAGAVMFASCNKDEDTTPTPDPTPTLPSLVGNWRIDSLSTNVSVNGVSDPLQSITAPSLLFQLTGNADFKADNTGTMNIRISNAILGPIIDSVITVNKWWRVGSTDTLRVVSGPDTLNFKLLTNTASKNVIELRETDIDAGDTTRVQMRMVLSK